MPKCIDQGFPCQNPDYLVYDGTAKKELRKPISTDVIVNQSDYCQHVPTNKKHNIGDLDHNLFLKPLGQRDGVYHLWVEYDECDDHETYTMRCVYVGKGPPKTRVDDHVKTKWPDSDALYVTFHECENRLAKYYEQLFLDTYQFDLNKNENEGKETLFAVWDEERFSLGTHLNEISNLSKMTSTGDW